MNKDGIEGRYFWTYPLILMCCSERWTERSSSRHWMGRYGGCSPRPLVQVRIICLVHNFRTTHYIHIHMSNDPLTAPKHPSHNRDHSRAKILVRQRFRRFTTTTVRFDASESCLRTHFNLEFLIERSITAVDYYGRVFSVNTIHWQSRVYVTVTKSERTFRAHRCRTNCCQRTKIPYPCNCWDPAHIFPSKLHTKARPAM